MENVSIGSSPAGDPAAVSSRHGPPTAEFVLQQMAATVQEAFWLSPPDLKTLLFVNSAFEQVWGRSRTEALNSPALVVEAAHPEDRTRIERELQNVSPNPQDIPYRIIRPDGSIRWIRNRVHAVLDEEGRTVMLAGAAVDVSEQRIFQKTLIESYARLVTVLDSIDADVCVTDIQTHEILFANRHLRESHGQDLLGKKCWAVLRHEPGPCGRCSGRNLSDPDGNPGRPVAWEELNPITGKWCLNHDRAIKWVDGRMVRIQIAADITRVKELEGKHLRIQAQLQQAQKMEAIGTLAGGIAHDFNNILSAIMGYTEIALMDSALAAPVRRSLKQVMQAATRARDLVKQILAFSRQNEQALKPVRLSQVVQEALNLVRASLPTTITIRQRLRSLAVTMADPTQIHQVILNLCTNAAHAMQEKGGELIIALEEITPDPALLADHPGLAPGPCQMLTIQDNGHGIPQDIIGRIFDPFFTTKQCGEGTGMGLAVVLGIIQSHRGVITVESEAGKGTAFRIYLPIMPESETQVAVEPSQELPPGDERVLLIDDEQHLVIVGKRMLEQLGYQVTARGASHEALEAFERDPGRFDLVITDMTMPGMTGDDLARKLLFIRPDIPIILCTGYSQHISPERAKALGIREFVLKPLIMAELAHTVRRALDSR